MEDKPKFAFVGNSHMAFWALNVYFPQWECLTECKTVCEICSHH